MIGFGSGISFNHGIMTIAGSLLLALPGLYFARTLANGAEDGQVGPSAKQPVLAAQPVETDKQADDENDRVELAARLEDVSREAGELRHILRVLDGAVRCLAAGGVSIRISESFPEEFEGLRSDFNHSVARLQEPLAVASTVAASLHGTVADIQAEARHLGTGIAAEAGRISSLAAETSSVLEAIRAREAEIDHIADIGHNAVLDMRRGSAGQDAPLATLQELASVAEQLAPAADRIVELALRTNMAAMQLRISADRTEGSVGNSGAVAEMTGLAAHAAEAAKTIAQLARKAGQVATEGERQVGQLVGELAAASVYLETLQQRTAALTQPEAHRRRELSSLRGAVLSLAKSNRDHVAHVDIISRKSADLTLALAKLTQETAGLSPFQVAPPNGAFAPSSRPKRPPHLRLIKS
jgi:methyl-accepting chemotaxis protein